MKTKEKTIIIEINEDFAASIDALMEKCHKIEKVLDNKTSANSHETEQNGSGFMSVA